MPFPLTNRIYAVLSKYQCVILLDSFKDKMDNFVLISINDPDSSYDISESIIKHKISDYIKLFFYDSEDGDKIEPPISDKQIEELLNFILRNKDKQFIIHCEAGIARSSAVAQAIHCILDYNGDIYKWTLNIPETLSYKNGFYPNRYVFLSLVNKAKNGGINEYYV